MCIATSSGEATECDCGQTIVFMEYHIPHCAAFKEAARARKETAKVIEIGTKDQRRRIKVDR